MFLSHGHPLAWLMQRGLSALRTKHAATTTLPLFTLARRSARLGPREPHGDAAPTPAGDTRHPGGIYHDCLTDHDARHDSTRVGVRATSPPRRRRAPTHRRRRKPSDRHIETRRRLDSTLGSQLRLASSVQVVRRGVPPQPNRACWIEACLPLSGMTVEACLRIRICTVGFFARGVGSLALHV